MNNPVRDASNQLVSDIDTMRDAYLNREQRAAYERITALAAEVEGLRADARRYQHSRDSALTEVAGRRGITVTDELRRKHHAAFDASVDAEIDAAMQEKRDG